MSPSPAEVPAGAISAALRADLEQIRWLLNLHGLPVVDIDDTRLENFVVYRDSIGVAAMVALERHDDLGLLRSLVARKSAPPAIRQTSQFSDLCPASAVLMVKP